MIKTDSLILFREDLIDTKKSFESIAYADFSVLITREFLVNSIVLFVESNGKTKVLKNRYGNEGSVS